jgi:hypothetical protein
VHQVSGNICKWEGERGKGQGEDPIPSSLHALTHVMVCWACIAKSSPARYTIGTQTQTMRTRRRRCYIIPSETLTSFHTRSTFVADFAFTRERGISNCCSGNLHLLSAGHASDFSEYRHALLHAWIWKVF